MKLRISMLALTLIACGPAAWAADVLTAQLEPAPGRTVQPVMKSAPALDQQVAALQQQVAALQAQVNALLAVVRVSNTGGVQIAAQSVEIRSDTNLVLRAGGNLYGDASMNATLRAAAALSVTSGAGLTLQSSANMDLKGSTIRLNNGGKPIATVGSLVQMQAGGGGQIVNGTQTVFVD
jgi:hypothetical protein